MAHRDVTIKLTLNKITREVEGCVFERSGFSEVYVYRIKMTTVHGSKSHLGTLGFRFVEGKTDYSERDIIYANYSGMRGNGHARRSRLRYIGFED